MTDTPDRTISAGAEMLIERMKTNPDDFKFQGKFYRVVQTLQSPPMAGAGWIPSRDFAALKGAYEELVIEPEFNEWVYGAIFNPPEPVAPSSLSNALGQSMLHTKNAVAGGLLSQAFSDPRALYANAAQQTTSNTISMGATTSADVQLTDSMLKQIKTKLGL